MHYLGILGVPRRYYAYGDSIEFIPQSVHDGERVHHDRRADRGRSAARVPLQPVWSLYFSGKPAGPQSVARDHARVADARHAAEARQLGARTCRSSIAGPTTTACPARREDFIPQNVPPGADDAGRGARGEVVNLTIAYVALATGSRGRGSCSCVSCSTKSWEPQPATSVEATRQRAFRPPRASGCGCSWRVVTSLFALFIVRVLHAHGPVTATSWCSDWNPLPEPRCAVAQHGAS